MANHYINENEDVLVSNENPNEAVWYEIPIGFTCYNSNLVIINQNCLFRFCVVHSMSYAVKKEMTWHNKMNQTLELLGYNIPSSQDYVAQYSKQGFVTNAYKWYGCLALGTLYGGNYNSFELLKPFTIPASYINGINREYSSQKVKDFIASLIKNGSIAIANL